MSRFGRCIRSPKYRAIMMVQYAGGLRISEACRLQPQDIDAQRRVIHVRAGKGDKDRYTVLSERLLAYLREYYRKHRPEGWLFPGKTTHGHASPEQRASRGNRDASRQAGTQRRAQCAG
jgi:integrase/recombinase XerD